MSFDQSHQATLVELARVERDQAAIRAAADELVTCLKEEPAFYRSLPLRMHDAIDRLEALVPWRNRPQDPVADAAEDEAFRAAVARMDAAELREDALEAAAALAKGKP